MMMNYCILILLDIYFYCVGAGARLRKESATANQQPLSSSLREQVSVVNAARGDQSSVIRYDYQIYPSVSPGRDLKYIIEYNQRYNAILDWRLITYCAY